MDEKSRETDPLNREKLITKWENRIAWLRTYAEEQFFEQHRRGLTWWDKMWCRRAMAHYDGCIRQIEGCINELREAK